MSIGNHVKYNIASTGIPVMGFSKVMKVQGNSRKRAGTGKAEEEDSKGKERAYQEWNKQSI